MEDFFNNPIFPWWILRSLISFILGVILGWWLWNNKKRILELEAENKEFHDKAVSLEADINSWKYKYEELEKSVEGIKTSLNRCEADKQIIEFKLKKCQEQIDGDAPAAASASVATKSTVASAGSHNYSGIFERENLQIVEGIGPKIQKILLASGIKTWPDLAAASEADLRGILEQQGPNYRIHNPSSWPKQAGLAADGKWDELVKYQKELGSDGDGDSPSKVQKLAMKILGFSNNPEDLKIIEGVGPKIEQLLKDGGINNWSELAGAEVARLQEILTAAGDRYRLADPGTWPKQAELAANGQWKELSEYQDHLKGGKES